ncbi:MAG TPA: beta-ketoacyl-ACP synthase III [Actinomycetota bacterium]|nr:beta-ketoacyl-ACP synthase III [Actinomycetota bacterium]
MGAVLTGLGVALPERVLDNATLASSLDITEDWIVERTGIRERRIAAENETIHDFAVSAGAVALASAGVSQVDMVVCATFTPDLRLPGIAPRIADALGLAGAGAYDLNAGCAGFLYGLAQASALVESGAARRVLLVGVDLMSRVTDYNDAKSCVLFGDGAGAVVVEASAESRIGPFRLHADGAQWKLLSMPSDTNLIKMSGREVYRHAVAGMVSSIREVLAAADVPTDEVDLVVAHQANARILRAVGERLGLPERKVITNIAKVGNTSAASIPLALADAVQGGTLLDDDLVVLAAFGAGFAWGAGLTRWGVPPESVGAAAVKEVARV